MQQTDNMAGRFVTSHINMAIRFFSKDKYDLRPDEHDMLVDWSTSLPNRQYGDCTDHRARYTRGLYRPPSTIYSGIGRPVCPINHLETIPTTEDMLGDWSTSSPNRQSRDCTDHRALYARGLADHFSRSDWLFPFSRKQVSRAFDLENPIA